MDSLTTTFERIEALEKLDKIQDTEACIDSILDGAGLTRGIGNNGLVCVQACAFRVRPILLHGSDAFGLVCEIGTTGTILRLERAIEMAADLNRATHIVAAIHQKVSTWRWSRR